MKYFKKRVVASVVVLIIILSNLVCQDISAFSNSKSLIINGRIAPQSAIQNLFENKDDINKYPEILLDGMIDYNNNAINIEGMIGDKEVSLSGDVYLSYRTQNGVKSYVVDLKDSTNNYEVLYCEINYTASDSVLDMSLRGKKALTLYLRDKDNNLLSFNKEITNTDFIGLNPTDIAPHDIDFNWFLDILKPVEITESEEMPHSLHSSTWTGSIETVRFVIGGTEQLYRAVPYLDYSYEDLGTTGISEWWMSLKISESAEYRYVGSSSWIKHTGDYGRMFMITNPTLSWTCGSNSIIRSYSNRGNYLPQGASNPWGTASLILNVFGIGAPFSTISAIAEQLWNSNGGTPLKDPSGGVNATSFKLVYPSNSYIEISGYGKQNYNAQRFELAVNVSTINSNLQKNYITNGIAKFKFDLKWAAGLGGTKYSKTYNRQITFSYVGNQS